MDVSPEYVAQCDCPEIQKLKCYKKGDWLWRNSSKYGAEVLIGTLPNGWNGDITEKVTWLPTQDQLQAMLGAKNLKDMLGDFWQEFADSEDAEGYFFSLPDWAIDAEVEKRGGATYVTIKNNELKFTSMEQLWLAFYMHEVHSKIWVDDKWTKEG